MKKKIAVMVHPVHTGVKEVLFNVRGTYVSVDNCTPRELLRTGFKIHTVLSVDPVTYYRLMSKALAEKVLLLDCHYGTALYKECKNRYRQFAKHIISMQLQYEEDFDIPEIVQEVANH